MVEVVIHRPFSYLLWGINMKYVELAADGKMLGFYDPAVAPVPDAAVQITDAQWDSVFENRHTHFNVNTKVFTKAVPPLVGDELRNRLLAEFDRVEEQIYKNKLGYNITPVGVARLKAIYLRAVDGKFSSTENERLILQYTAVETAYNAHCDIATATFKEFSGKLTTNELEDAKEIILKYIADNPV